MASAYSVPQSMGQYIQPVNLNLVNAALGAKQQKYDYNVAKIDSVLAEFGNVTLARDEDKQYLSDRIDNVLSAVNQIQKKDLSSNNLTREINQHISSAIDDRVLEQVANTQRLMSFEKTVAEKREKKPDTYSDINYTFAKEQAGVSDYLKGTDKEGKKVDSFGNLNYVDYKDVNKRINDFVLDIQNKKKDEVIEVPDGQGGIMQTTISGLSPTQVRNLAASQLDASYMKQIEINGWYNAGTYDNVDKIKNDVTAVFDNKVKALDAEQTFYQRKLDNGSALSDADKLDYQEKLASYSNEKATLSKNRDYLLTNTAAASTYLETERVLGGAVNAFSSLYSETTKVVKDELYFAQQDLALKRMKLEHDVEKEARESSASSIVTTVPTTTENNIPEVEAYIDSSIAEFNDNINTTVQAYKAAVQVEADKGNQSAVKFMDEYQKRLATKSADQTDEEVFSTLASTEGYNSDLAIIGNRNFLSEIKENKEKLGILLEGKAYATQQGMAAHIDSTINSKEGLKAFFDNPDTKMMFNGKAISVRDMLISKGIMDKNGNKIGDLKSQPEVLKELEKSYYVDDVLSKGFGKANGSLKKLISSLGESYDTVVKSFELEVGNRGRVETQYTIQPNSKTAKYLEQAHKNGVYDTVSFSDQSLSGDDSTIGRFLKEDYKNSDVYRANLNKFYNKLPTTQVVGITPEDKGNYQRLSSLITASGGSFIPDKAATINMRLEGDNVIVSQAQSEKVDKQNVVVNKETKILKADFMRNLPELSKKLNFSTEAAFYNIDKIEGRNLKSESIKFFDNSTSKKNYNYASQVLLVDTPKLIPYIDSTSAKSAIYNTNKILESKYPNLSEVIDKALSQSSNFAINSTVERDFNGNPFIEMKLVDKRSQKIIHSISDNSQINIDNFKRIMDNTPQVYYSLMLNDILATEQQQMMLGSKTPSASYKNLTEKL